MLIGIAVASSLFLSLTAFVMAVQLRFAEEVAEAERLRRSLLG
jgi:hypothetical protein